MKRRNFDEDIPLPPHGQPPAVEKLMPCLYCGVQTAYDTLASLGARCRRCYDFFCCAPQPAPNVPPEAVPDHAGDRAWAYKLRWREAQGEKLTLAQRETWRAGIWPQDRP